MSKPVTLIQPLEREIPKAKRSELGNRLAELQRELSKTELSMLIIVDGWELSGKGFILKDLTRELDPRYYEVSVFAPATDEERSHSFLWRFFKKIPPQGKIAIFDRSFYYELLNELSLSEHQLEHQTRDISFIEKLLFHDNTLVVKFFLHHSQKNMKKRLDTLKADPIKSFMVTAQDEKQLKKYDKYQQHFADVLNKTNFEDSPWYVLDTDNQKDASRLALTIAIEQLEHFLSVHQAGEDTHAEGEENAKHYAEPVVDYLGGLDLSLSLSDEEYEKEVEQLQQKAGDLLYELWLKKIPCIVVYEGTDAAGKGGNIQRLTRLMDPRGFDVATTAAPSHYERSYHYLWRFYQTFPEKGKLTVYDRSWYGRVLVERIEKLTPVARWKQAYEEINQMEHNLKHEGYLVFKYLIIIDKEEQRKRFEARQADPEKNYKLTDEDWRNHEKFDQYVVAMNEMLARTGTEEVPWKVIEGTDKKYARIKVLRDFVERVSRHIEEVEHQKKKGE